LIELPDCRDGQVYHQTVLFLEAFFHRSDLPLQELKTIAQKIRACVGKISPVIQQTTEIVCPHCKNVCCVSKHGYYLFEDLVYLHASGIKPPPLKFGNDDAAPCQFLAENGCTLERSMRPSGCNWYFCDSLLDHLEDNPGYPAFDDSLQDAATLWLEMMEEFSSISSSSP